MSDTRVLTIRQPWAGLIVLGIKDIENRTWGTKHRGKMYIHSSSQRFDRFDPWEWIEEHIGDINIDWLKQQPAIFTKGAILGSCHVSEIVRDSKSPWAIKGQKHWELTKPHELVHKKYCRGERGLWRKK